LSSDLGLPHRIEIRNKNNYEMKCVLLKKKIVLSTTKEAPIRKLFSNYERVSAELLFFTEFMQQ